MARGRPPIAPRVEKLERQVTDLMDIIARLGKKIHELEQNSPQSKAYEPLFDRWPSNGR